MTTATPRNSAFELLRIVAMFMILVVHFDGAALGLPTPEGALSGVGLGKTIVEALSIPGVNLFVLISGYFLINLTWRRAANYLIMCLFYSLGIFAVKCCVETGGFTLEGLWEAIRVLSSTDLWFVRDYFMLMLMAPLLNGGLRSLSPRMLCATMGGLVFINCYMGWWWHGAVNPTGYTLMQMIFVYCTGYCLRQHALSAWWGAALYVMSTVAIVTLSAVMEPGKLYAYNSPMVMGAAIGLFLIFARLQFSSRVVNAIASGTFAVYLIHKNPYVWVSWVVPMVRDIYAGYSGVMFWMVMAGLTVGVFAACIAIDRLRVLLHIRISNGR